jgi:polyhydroxyalkanoate synthesis regulator phasin
MRPVIREKIKINKTNLTVLLLLPFLVSAQQKSGTYRSPDVRARVEFARGKIEGMVRSGEITPEQGRERLAGLKRRIAAAGQQDRNPVVNRIEDAYKKYGIEDLSRIRSALSKRNIPEEQIDSVLRGILRMIPAAKKSGKDFSMDPRMRSYFGDRLGLNEEQIKTIGGIAARIAMRSG